MTLLAFMPLPLRMDTRVSGNRLLNSAFKIHLIVSNLRLCVARQRCTLQISSGIMSRVGRLSVPSHRSGHGLRRLTKPSIHFDWEFDWLLFMRRARFDRSDFSTKIRPNVFGELFASFRPRSRTSPDCRSSCSAPEYRRQMVKLSGIFGTEIKKAVGRVIMLLFPPRLLLLYSCNLIVLE